MYSEKEDRSQDSVFLDRIKEGTLQAEQRNNAAVSKRRSCLVRKRRTCASEGLEGENLLEAHLDLKKNQDGQDGSGID